MATPKYIYDVALDLTSGSYKHENMKPNNKLLYVHQQEQSSFRIEKEHPTKHQQTAF